MADDDRRDNPSGRRRGRYFFDVTAVQANRDGEEVEISCTVTLQSPDRKRVISGKVIDFYAIGRKITSATDENGTASIAERVPAFAPGKHTLLIQVRGETESYRKEFELAKGPKAKSSIERKLEQAKLKTDLAKAEQGLAAATQRKATKLELIGKPIVSCRRFIITLARSDDRGPVPGKVRFFTDDPEDGPGVYSQESEEDGTATIEFAIPDRRREVTFFLPEKPEVKITVDIPAKLMPVQTQPELQLPVPVLGPFERGRMRVRRWHGLPTQGG